MVTVIINVLSSEDTEATEQSSD